MFPCEKMSYPLTTKVVHDSEREFSHGQPEEWKKSYNTAPRHKKYWKVLEQRRGWRMKYPVYNTSLGEKLTAKAVAEKWPLKP